MKKLRLSSLLLGLLALWTITGCPPVEYECSREPHSRPHPYVFWDQADLDAVLARVAVGHPDRVWAKPILDGILASADGWLTADVTVPDRGGQWPQEYVCPNHGVSLVYDPDSPLAHVCPAGGEVWTGEPYDSAWISYRNDSLASAARTLGLAALLASDAGLRAAYADRAAQILLGYADRYPTYELHDRWGGTLPMGARAFAQTLDESVWLLRLVAGYDSIYDSGQLTPVEKGQIEDDLLCASVRTILRYDAGMSNWQAWHNAAIGTVGFLLEDTGLIEKAIEGLHGFDYHMQASVLEDGLWYEGALTYHYYTLEAYRQLSEAALRSGVDLYADPSYRKMYDGPVDLILPNLEFPRINDAITTHDSVAGRAAFYEVANTRWNNDRENWLLDRIYAAGTSRSTWEALLYGTEIDGGVTYELPSVNLEASGLGVLRAGTAADLVYLLLDYGPHGGGHGHDDKLALLLARGRELLPDLGTVQYSLPAYEGWYKRTVGHNTLVMGEASQLPAGEGERAIDFFGAPQADLQVMQATVGGEVYPWGGGATRTLALVRDDYVLDVVQASGGLSPYDLVYHVLADAVETSGGLSFSDLPADVASRWASSSAGYDYLQPPSSLNGASHVQIQRAAATGPWSAVLTLAGSPVGLHVQADGSEPTSLIVADAPGNPFTEHHPALILRREGVSSARYVCVLEPFEGTPQVQSVSTSGNVVTVSYGTETHRITVDQAGRSYVLEVLD